MALPPFRSSYAPELVVAAVMFSCTSELPPVVTAWFPPTLSQDPLPMRFPPAQNVFVLTSRARTVFVVKSYSVAHCQQREGAQVSGAGRLHGVVVALAAAR